MPGFSDYTAQAVLDWEAGRVAMPALGARYLALFTLAPTSDAGTGGTEVSGGSYARIQVAGTIAAASTWTTATPNITMGAANPGWVQAGMEAYDATNSQRLGVVSSYSGTALVLTANALHASSGSTDNINFSAFSPSVPSSGTPASAPASTTNTNTTLNYAPSSANWGTVIAWGLYDALTSGNLITWDYLGNNKWLPFTCTAASPGVLDAPANGYSNGAAVAVTSKYDGTLPATAGSWAGVLTVAGASGDTFNVGVNTTGTGNGQVRLIQEQAIPSGITATFSTSTFTLTAA